MKHKRYLALPLALCLLLSYLSGCGQQAPETDTEPTEGTVSSLDRTYLHYDYTPEAAENRAIEITKEQAVVAVAEAFMLKGPLIQYDQLWSSRQNNDHASRSSRWDFSFAPEQATSQMTKYVDCSKFQYAVYYNAFGYELPAVSTDNMLDYPELQVLYYEPTNEESDEEEADICQYVADMLQPGDLLSYRFADDSNGHIEMYVGEGMLIHATGSVEGGGDYVYESKNGEPTKVDTVEAIGTVMKDSLARNTTWTDADNYLLNQLKFGILRPLDFITEADITQDTYCRTAFMQGIVSEVTSSVSPFRTAQPGDTITYTLTMQNLDSSDRNVHLDISPAEHTTLTQTETAQDIVIPATKTVQVQITVAIDSDSGLLGQSIAGPVIKANGMTIAVNEQLVGTNLSAEAVSKLASLDYAQSGVTDSYQLVTWAYEQLDTELPFRSVEELMWSLFARQDYNNIALDLRTDTRAAAMVPDGWYGGTSVKNAGDEPGSRISNPTAANIQPGDILLVSEDLTMDTTDIYLCTAEYTLAQWSEEYGEVVYYRQAYMAEILGKLLGQEAYALLRPASVNDGGEVPEPELDQPDTRSFKGMVLITSQVVWEGKQGRVEVMSLADGVKRVVVTDTPAAVYSGRVYDMTVSGGKATFQTPATAGLYDGTEAAKQENVIYKAGVASWDGSTLTYVTDSGTGTVKTNENTVIVQVSDTLNYGNLTDAAVGTDIPAAQTAAQGVQWNLLFVLDEEGVCRWVIVERDGNDISRSVGNPLALN